MWSQQDYLLADLFDIVNNQRWLFQSWLYARGKQDPPPFPAPYPRPGATPPEPETPKFASAQQLTEFFGPQ